LGLRAPLRRQRYVNAGFISLSTSRWPDFPQRFWRLSERIPTDAPFGPDPDHPFWAGDQDVLNALLMSEIPADAIEIGRDGSEVHPDELSNTQIIDAKITALCAERTADFHRSLRDGAEGVGPEGVDPRSRRCLRKALLSSHLRR
jgi:hypothetical protein